jgi:hypothetical protein
MSALASRTDTSLPLEHDFRSSPVDANAFTLPPLLFPFCLPADRPSFSPQQTDIQTPSNAGLVVLLEEAWYTLPSPSIHLRSLSRAPAGLVAFYSLF